MSVTPASPVLSSVITAHSYQLQSYLAYTTSETDTTYSVTITAAGVYIKSPNGLSMSGSTATCTLSGDGGTTYTVTKSVKDSESGGTHYQPYITSKTYTWTKDKTVTTKTVKNVLTFSSSSYFSGQSATATITVTVPIRTRYAITFNANQGTGAPSGTYYKYHGITLTLPATPTPTRTGYTFIGWNVNQAQATAGSWTHKSGGTYERNEANVLYAAWKQDYIKPAITVVAFRSDSGGDAVEDGGYISVSAKITAGKNGGTYLSGNYTITISGISGSTTGTYSASSSQQTLGPFIKGGSLDPETAYKVTVTLSDTVGSNTVSKTVSAVSYPFNVLYNGSAVGLMTPAVSGRKVSVPELFIGSTNVGTALSNASSHISAVKDYISSQGSSSPWYYRKWNSGRIESWGILSNTAVAGSTWGSLYYYDLNISIPSGIFSEAPIRAYATSGNSQWMVVGVYNLTATSATVRLIKPVSSSQAISVYVYLLSF